MNDLSILISTYDDSSSLWRPLEKSYSMYWKDLNYPIYVASNFIELDQSKFIYLKIGEEKSWSDNVLKCLDKIQSKYIMFALMTLFWANKINNDLFNKTVQECFNNNWEYLRLHPSPKSNLKLNDNFSIIKAGMRYRASLAFSIFRKDVLISLLDEMNLHGNLKKMDL